MKLVVLDGYALNPGDLSWEPLRALAQCDFYDRTPESEILSRAAGAEVLLTNKTPLRAETLSALPSLRYIGVLATGYDVVDVAQAGRQGVAVTNIPAYGTGSVAQMVFSLLLELCNSVALHSDLVRQGEWSRSPDWCFWRRPLVELSGKTMGLIGFGRIGKQVAGVARALGMRVIATGSRRPVEAFPEVEWHSLDELLAQADVVSLHCPLQPSTRGLIDAERIAGMKRGALLINTSRGALIVEEDLAAALNSGALGGAGLDVLSKEPPPASNPLLSARNCIITPHIAWATREARERLLHIAASNLKMWMDGSAENIVG